MAKIFQLFEIVEVLSTDQTAKSNIAGRLGVILGIAPAEEEAAYATYAVHIYDREIVFSCRETELRSTGRSANREKFYTGEMIRVTQTGELSDDQPI